MSDTCNKRNTLKALDCIGRQAAIEALEREKVYMSGFQSDGTIIHPFEKYNRGLEDGIEALKVLPSAQPEREEGRWIIQDHPATGWFRVLCSECGEDVTSNAPIIGFFPNAKCIWDFCPWCGAKMGGIRG